MSNEDLKARQEFEASLIEKARTDEAFKQELISNPREAVNREIQATQPGAPAIPAHIEVSVHQETAGAIHLVLPMDAPSGELTDEDLEAVAGGSVYGNDDCSGEYAPDCSSGDDAAGGDLNICQGVFCEDLGVGPKVKGGGGGGLMER